MCSCSCFGFGAWKALRLLWLREERYDLESYVAVHQGVIFGALTLLAGGPAVVGLEAVELPS